MTDHYAEAERLLFREYRNHKAARTGYMAAQVHVMLAAADGQRAPLTLMERAMAAAPPKPADTEPPVALSIPWPPDEATVRRCAERLHAENHTPNCDCHPAAWTAWAADARAVLDALAGAR